MASRSSVPFYLSVPSLRVRSISPYRIEAGQCAPFLSARFPSLTAFVFARLFVSSLFSSPRLVWRLVSILCGSPVVSSGSSIRRRLVASSRQEVRFPVLFIVPRCFALPGSSFLVSCSRLVRSSRQAVRILSFRLAARLGGSWCRVGFSLSPVSSSSVLVSSHSLPFHGHGDGQRLVICGFVSLRRVPLPLPRRGIRLGDDGWHGDGRAVRRYEGRAVLFSSFSPSG